MMMAKYSVRVRGAVRNPGEGSDMGPLFYWPFGRSKLEPAWIVLGWRAALIMMGCIFAGNRGVFCFVTEFHLADEQLWRKRLTTIITSAWWGFRVDSRISNVNLGLSTIG